MTDQHIKTINIAPRPEDLPNIRTTLESGIKDWEAVLLALTELAEQVKATQYGTRGRQTSEIYERVSNWVQEEEETIQASILKLQWGIKEIDHGTEIKNSRHYEVQYGYDGHCLESAYISVMAEEHFGDVEKAFFALTSGVDDEMEVFPRDQADFTADGEYWPEEQEEEEEG